MILLIGESGGGKTTVEKLLLKKGLNRIISYTTRQPRKGEVEGFDYYYVSKKSFQNLDKLGFFAESTMYRDNHYGIGINDCDPNSVVVVEVEGFKQLQQKLPGQITAIYIKASEETRASRMLGRGDKFDSVVERITTDRVHFEGLEDLVDWTIDTDDLDPEDIANHILELVNR